MKRWSKPNVHELCALADCVVSDVVCDVDGEPAPTVSTVDLAPIVRFALELGRCITPAAEFREIQVEFFEARGCEKARY
jgi:hypothetical protein